VPRVILVLGKPEPDNVVPKSRPIVAALRRPMNIVAAPRTTAEHPNRGVGLGGFVTGVRLVGFLAPFPHIAAHIVEAEFVGFFGAYQMGF